MNLVQRLQIRNQIRKLFRAEVADDAHWHHGDFLFDSVFDVLLMQVARDTSRVSHGNRLRAFESDEAGVDFAVAHGEGPCVEALCDLLAGIQN